MGLAALASLTLGGLVAASPAEAAFPGHNGKVAFTSGTGVAGREVHTVNPDGTGRTNVTNDPAGGEAPKWSPDGRRFLFFRFGQGSRVANADGSGVEPVPVTAAGPDRELYWAPDGQRIAYPADRPDNVACPGETQLEILTANLDGTGQRQLTAEQQTEDLSPAWSPDGTEIAFVRQQRELFSDFCDTIDSHLAVMNADGSGLVGITGGPDSVELHPDWSPDGTKIVYDGAVASHWGIFTINADGTGRTQLTDNGTAVVDGNPAWSPDGTKITFAKKVSSAPFNRDIYVMNADGSGQTNITNTSSDETDPDWQPIPHQSAPAPSYDHPRLASPVTASLVPNHRQTISSSQCPARGGLNSSHGAPLSFASCNPPGFVPGTRAFFGPGSDSFATYAVIYGDTNAANGDQANMTLRASLNDIRTSTGTDYPADLTLLTRLRITDRHNGASQSDPATVRDFELLSPIACTATAGAQGSACNLDSSLDAQTPGAIKENKGTVVQVFRFRANDSGANGTRGDSDDRTFAVQGIYIP